MIFIKKINMGLTGRKKSGKLINGATLIVPGQGILSFKSNENRFITNKNTGKLNSIENQNFNVPIVPVLPSPTPTPTFILTPTLTPTNTSTPTPTPSFTPTLTSTITPTPSFTPTLTITPSSTPAYVVNSCDNLYSTFTGIRLLQGSNTYPYITTGITSNSFTRNQTKLWGVAMNQPPTEIFEYDVTGNPTFIRNINVNLGYLGYANVLSYTSDTKLLYVDINNYPTTVDVDILDITTSSATSISTLCTLTCQTGCYFDGSSLRMLINDSVNSWIHGIVVGPTYYLNSYDYSGNIMFSCAVNFSAQILVLNGELNLLNNSTGEIYLVSKQNTSDYVLSGTGVSINTYYGNGFVVSDQCFNLYAP